MTVYQQATMHTTLDWAVNFHTQRYVTTKETKYFVVQEREVSYRLTLHSHPYVGALLARMIRQGVPGLQAADTEYRPRHEALAESIHLALAPGLGVAIPTGAQIALAADTTVGLGGGGTIGLAKGLRLRTTAAGSASAPNGVLAVLVGGMLDAPAVNSLITLPAQPAYLFADTLLTLTANLPVVLFNGAAGTVPAGSKVILAAQTTFPLAANTPATLQRWLPRPVLHADLITPYSPSALVTRPRPVRDLDFSSAGAYSLYNWELFFHTPLTMALHLSKNQHYADAQRWLHFIFDPTDDSDGPTPARFWKVRPFQSTDVKKVEELLVNLAAGTDQALAQETANSIDAWQRAPFRPDVVARFRIQAYMYRTVMAYLDNLIAWGDSLFRQDTGEAIDEALNLYMLASAILGPRPQAVPAKGTVKPATYANLRADLAKFGTVMRAMEAEVPYDLMPLPPADDVGDGGPQTAMIRSLGKALYFCVPRNDKLLGYWDTVADRLFKIRNSLNLSGVFRKLALFEPPIDPALLVRATAAGLDLASVIGGLNQPLPLVRFTVLADKAAELAGEVRSLGGALLAAIEKDDGEALSLLRSKHEIALLELAEQVKYAQAQEGAKTTQALRESLASAKARYTFFERQLGRSADEIAKALPDLEDLDLNALVKQKLAALEPAVAARDIAVDIAGDFFADAAGLLMGGHKLSSHEVRETIFHEFAQLSNDIGAALGAIGSAAAVVPQFEVSAEPWGMGGATSFGGQNVGSGFQAGATAARGIGDRLAFEARRASRIDGLARREREWEYQSNLAAAEINQILKQLRASQIRAAIADLELRNHRKQLAQARDIDYYLNVDGTNRTGKTSNKSFYAWLRREVKGLYAQCFQIAFDAAKKAERALQHELGDPALSYLRFGYLDGKEGLLAGERLYLDIKRMQLAQLELNRREYELTKHVSVLQLDPGALLELRATGRCSVSLPEDLFNLDGPGHFFRRIKTVAVSVPCVTGPYSGVNLTLTLTRSSIRTTPVLGERDYARETDTDDDRFSDNFAPLTSVVASSGQNDPGLFEAHLRDERYLPFENSGVISTWELALPANPSAGEPTQFDYNTIADVILHLRYTAREGGQALRAKAMTDLRARIAAAQTTGSHRLLSLRHDFPDAWAAYRAAPATAGFRPLRISLTPAHFPYWSRVVRPQPAVLSARLIAASPTEVKVAAPDRTPATTDNLAAIFGDLRTAEITKAPLPAFTGTWEVAIFDPDLRIRDAWLVLDWGAE
ncbi:MAG: insecticidal toxin protein [Candidatus Nanopelagicales bacterium]